MSELNETHKLGDRVIMNHPTLKGVTGHITEIRNGAYKGAPKTYTIDYQHPKHSSDHTSSIQLDKKYFKQYPVGQLGESGNIDELNTSTLNSYIDKAVVDAKKKEKAGDKAKSPEVSYKNFRSAAKRLSNVNKARGKVARQEFADKVGL